MINSRILKILERARTSTYVDLSNCAINDSELKEIIDKINLHYSHITELNLAHNPISDIGADYLSLLKNVEKLDLTQTAIYYEGVVKLLKSKIKIFIFDNCDLSEKIQPHLEDAKQAGKIIHDSVCTYYNTVISCGQ